MNIDKDTKIFFSLASNPGNFGCKFFNYFFKKYGINAIYKSLKLENCCYKEFIDLIYSFKKVNVGGISVSMPYKYYAAKICDIAGFNNVNTIFFKNDDIVGYNTDAIGFEKCLRKMLDNTANPDHRFYIYGGGAVANSILAVVKNFSSYCRLFERQEVVLDVEDHCWNFLINASPVGMDHIEDKVFTKDRIKKFKYVFDVVNKKQDTNLIKLSKKLNKIYCKGSRMALYGAQQQFKIYTGIELTDKEVEKFYQKEFK